MLDRVAALLSQAAGWVSENESLFSGLAAMVALLAIVPAALRPLLRGRSGDSSASKGTGEARTADAATERPRLAVFPIQAASEAERVRTAAEILTDDLTTLLARSVGCEVISSRSSRAFASSGRPLADAESELGVRYVVEGTLRAESDADRITARLQDTHDDRVLWSQSFEVPTESETTAAHRVAERIASFLGVELTRAEVVRSRRSAPSDNAREFVLASQGVLFEQGHNRASYREAIGLLQRAAETDPSYAEAHGQLALLQALGSLFGFIDPDESAERAATNCERALEIDDQSSEVLGYVGCAYCDLRQYEQGIPLLERAVEANPSNAQARAALGTALAGQRRPEEAAVQLEKAIDLSPAYKGLAPWASVLAGVSLRLGRMDEAHRALDRALSCDATFFPAQLVAALLALAEGDRDAAEERVAAALRANPDLERDVMANFVGRRSAELLGAMIDERRAAQSGAAGGTT